MSTRPPERGPEVESVLAIVHFEDGTQAQYVFTAATDWREDRVQVDIQRNADYFEVGSTMRPYALREDFTMVVKATRMRGVMRRPTTTATQVAPQEVESG